MIYNLYPCESYNKTEFNNLYIEEEIAMDKSS